MLRLYVPRSFPYPMQICPFQEWRTKFEPYCLIGRLRAGRVPPFAAGQHNGRANAAQIDPWLLISPSLNPASLFCCNHSLCKAFQCFFCILAGMLHGSLSLIADCSAAITGLQCRKRVIRCPCCRTCQQRNIYCICRQAPGIARE